VRELLAHRRLVAAPHLREAGQARPHDEPLPVRRQLVGELVEEDGPDRPRSDHAHVPAQDVDELRDLVELRRLEPASDRRELGPSALYELLAEILAEPSLRSPAQGAELVHREHVRAPADALAAVEDRRPARTEHDEGDHEREREREEQEERGEDDVESAQDDVAGPLRRLERKLAVAADERVLDPRRIWHAVDRKAAAGVVGRPRGQL
jgi:hypothetical protein